MLNKEALELKVQTKVKAWQDKVEAVKIRLQANKITDTYRLLRVKQMFVLENQKEEVSGYQWKYRSKQNPRVSMEIITEDENVEIAWEQLSKKVDFSSDIYRAF